MPTKKVNNYVIYLDGDSNVIKLKRLVLSDKSIRLYVGQRMTLKYTTIPSNASYTEITWTSDNPDIADVNEDGVVTGLKNGKTVVRIQINNISVSCVVNVIEIIKFKDKNVKKICVRNWDKDGDGELSISEAAAVKEIPLPLFTGTPIKTFDELSYFKNLKTIGMHAFDSCSQLTSITFPQSLEKIGKNAFSRCTSMETITLSPGVTNIGSGAFTYCTNLTTVYVNNPVPPTNGERIFDYCDSMDSIKVPDISLLRYCDTVGWGVDENNEYLYYSYLWPHGFDYTFDFFLS